jgi:hypothetical protein
MARLIDSQTVIEIDPVVAGCPVLDLVEEVAAGVELFTVPRKPGGARLDHSFPVTDWSDW